MDSLGPCGAQCKNVIMVESAEKWDHADDRSSRRATLMTNQYDKTPQIDPLTKLREGARLALTRIRVTVQDISTKEGAVSQPGKFNLRYVQPLLRYGGRNDRIFLCGQQAGRVMIRNGIGEEQHVIQAASHNYAGLYGCHMDLLKLSVEKLPVLTSQATEPLVAATCSAVNKHFDTDFCVPIGSGYGANLLVFSALLSQDWILVLDEKSHNSMFVAAYLSEVGQVSKFRHNDMTQLEDILRQHQSPNQSILVAVEGFYSMDGTTPNIGELARLKRDYDFTLLADEAHSLICLGSSGKGCVERWNESHSQSPAALDLIDIRVATLSKALGTTGGLIFGQSKFENQIKSRLEVMSQSGLEAITTAACVKTTLTLSQTFLVRRKLLRLQAMAIFCRRYLQQAGIYIYGDYDSPILPVFAGRPTRAAKLSYILRQLGIIATPVSTPAVPFWESRVRICLSAAFDDEVVSELVRVVIQAAGTVGLCKKGSYLAPEFRYQDTSPSQQEEVELATSTESVTNLIMQCAAAVKSEHVVPRICRVGSDVLESYGLGSGGARLVAGTTDLHLRLEDKISNLFQQEECLTYSDAYVGLVSTVAALCRPVDGLDEHHLYVTHNAAQAIEDGIRVAPKDGSPNIERYGSLQSLLHQLRHYRPSGYLTIIVDSKEVLDASAAITEMLVHSGRVTKVANTSILVHGGSEFTDFARWSRSTKTIAARLLMYGSFQKQFSLPGSYLVGDPVLIEELRYTSRGYMFSASQQPYVTAITNAEILRAWSSV